MTGAFPSCEFFAESRREHERFYCDTPDQAAYLEAGVAGNSEPARFKRFARACLRVNSRSLSRVAVLARGHIPLACVTSCLMLRRSHQTAVSVAMPDMSKTTSHH